MEPLSGFKKHHSLDIYFPGKLNLQKMLITNAVLTMRFHGDFPTNSCIGVTIPGIADETLKICETKFENPYEINILSILELYAQKVSPIFNNIIIRITPFAPYGSPAGWTTKKAELALEYAVDNDG